MGSGVLFCKTDTLHPVGFEPTTSRRRRIMSALHSNHSAMDADVKGEDVDATRPSSSRPGRRSVSSACMWRRIHCMSAEAVKSAFGRTRTDTSRTPVPKTGTSTIPSQRHVLSTSRILCVYVFYTSKKKTSWTLYKKIKN